MLNNQLAWLEIVKFTIPYIYAVSILSSFLSIFFSYCGSDHSMEGFWGADDYEPYCEKCTNNSKRRTFIFALMIIGTITVHKIELPWTSEEDIIKLMIFFVWVTIETYIARKIWKRNF